MFGHGFWSGMISTAVVITGIYLVLLLAMMLFQSKMIYFPSNYIHSTPSDAGMNFEDVYFQTSDSVKLHGWFIPAGDARATVLFFHGNAGNISDRLESVRIFHELGLNTFIFDYRGYGKSGGQTTEKGTYLDSEAALDYLLTREDVIGRKIILFGRSLGGSIAAWLARERSPDAVILESAFTSMNDVAAKHYPFVPVRLLSRFDYNTRDYIREVKCPALVIHSRGDELIPFEHGEKLFETAREPKEFLEMTGSHNDGFFLTGQKYVSGLDSFISSIIDREK